MWSKYHDKQQQQPRPARNESGNVENKLISISCFGIEAAMQYTPLKRKGLLCNIFILYNETLISAAWLVV